MDKKFSLLYFSYAFIANHGGKLHSEAFYKRAKEADKVKEISVFPDPESGSTAVSHKDSKLRKLVKRSSFLQILFFYRRNYTSFKAIVPVIKSKKVDCLHIRVDSNFLMIPRLRRLFPELVITTEINASPFDENAKNIAFSKIFKRLERRSLSKAHANFFVSDFLRKRIMGEEIKTTRDFVAHNGVDREIFKPRPRSADREENIVTLGYVGTIDFHKKVKILIDAFLEVHKACDGKVELLIIGDGPDYEKLKEYVQEKELSPFVKFKGRVKHSEILEHLYSMDIAIHHHAKPYMSPLKLFEYMAVGLPVIGPDTPAVREVFEDKKDLLLVKGEEEDIVSKIMYLLKDDEKRKAIAKSGREKVHKHYGWEENAAKILDVIWNKFRKKN